MIKEVVLSFLVATTSVDKVEVDKFRHTEATCLAKNMYYEARNQGLAGQLAVSLVVMNRVKDSRYPNTVCGVVEQGPTRESWKKDGTYYPIKNRCQFSWFCDGKSDNPEDSKNWLKCLTLARNILQGEYGDITEGATHYHSVYVNPYWADSLNQTVTINEHIFYK